MTCVDIIIVNWNSGQQLRDCVDSIIQFSHSLVHKIIVVDNDSTDGSENALEGLENVTLIRAGANFGFGKACNLGAAHASSEYLLFLNPDVCLFPESLVKALEYMQRPESVKVGICGVQLVDENGAAGTSAARFPTLSVLTGKTLGLAKLLPSLFPPHFMDSVELNESKVVDQVIGALFLIRKSVFDQCQGFDERFFMYFEEVDLSLRAKQLGYSSYFLSDVTAFHKGGGCSEQVKATCLFYTLRSRVLYAQKHYSALSYALLIVLTVVELPLRLVHSVFRRSWSDTKNALIAYGQLTVYFLWRD